MTRKQVITFILAFAAITASAQDNNGQGLIFPFLRIDRSPVGTAMAGAGFSTTGENAAYAAFGNPAAAAFMDKKVSAAVSYRMWSPKMLDENQIGAAFAVKIGKKLSVDAGYVRDIQPIVDPETETFRPNQNDFSLGLAYAITDFLSIGVNGHYAMQELVKNYRIQGFCADAVVQYHLPNMNAALGLVSLGPKVESPSSGKSYKLPASMKLAGDYTLETGECLITGALDADYYLSGLLAASIGASLSWKDMLFFRIGGRYAQDGAPLPSHMAVGAGAKFGPVRLDLSYITLNKVIGNSLMGGLNIEF